MTLDYFYGAQADQFAFYRIPKALFTDERFKSISAEAKILYGILLDRMSLSRKNGWLDEQGRVFIIFTLEEVMEATVKYRLNNIKRKLGYDIAEMPGVYSLYKALALNRLLHARNNIKY